MQGFEQCLQNLKPTCSISFSRQSSACAASDLHLCTFDAKGGFHFEVSADAVKNAVQV